ncbi:MAG: MarR family winged helix-turn-helix transcriptional regulator [Acidobacteriaceae bacterium]
MSARSPKQAPNQSLHQALAEFRRQLRKFLLVSENAANDVGLHPQQHQLLLAVAGVPDGRSPSIAYAAEALGLKHNTVVELVDRCGKEGLLERASDPNDRRRVCLRTTARGQKVLTRLSQFHLQELNLLGPRLIQTLETVLQSQGKPHPRSSRKTPVAESHD